MRFIGYNPSTSHRIGATPKESVDAIKAIEAKLPPAIAAQMPPSPSQEKASYDFIIQNLERSKTGRYSSRGNTKRLGSKIKTAAQAKAVLEIDKKFIVLAAQAIHDYSLWDKLLTNIVKANVDLMMANVRSIKSIEKQIPKDGSAPMSELLAAKTALTTLQTLDNLNFTRKMVSESKAESTIDRLIDAFGDALAEVLKTAVNKIIIPVIEQVPKVGFALGPLLVPIGLAAGGFWFAKNLLAKK